MTGYSTALDPYTVGGWSVIPVRGKAPVPPGATGNGGTVTPGKQAEWAVSPEWSTANTAVRHEGTIAVDVDDPDGLTDLEMRFGVLPVTYTSTARGYDSPRRQHFFTLPEVVPDGYRIASTPVAGVDIPWHGHRYSVVFPSLHPVTGERYQWYGPDGELCNPPQVSDLEVLPQTWFDGLLEAHQAADDAAFSGGFTEWADLCRVGDSRMERRVIALILNGLPEVGNIDHNAIRGTLLSLIVAGTRGIAGVPDAITEVRRRYLFGKWDTPRYRDAFNKALDGAVERFGQFLWTDETATGPNLWSSRPELAALYQNARRTDAAPWPMLVGAILRALHTVPSRVLYQSYRGTAALNAAAVFVGVSGGGKSLLQTQLDNAVLFHHGARMWDFPAYEVGSGEALAETYISDRDHSTGELTWTNEEHAVSFGFDEVGRLTKVGARQGSTLFEYLKTAVTGGILGRRLANGGGLELPKNSYRFTATINAQPERAAPLISDDEIAGGLPGRLIWVSMKDPSVRAEHDDSPVEPWRVRGHAWQVDRIAALPEMDAAHQEQAYLIAEGAGDALTGHEVMARVKVAIGLMVLNERTHLNSEDWELAGLVMEHSRSTRDGVFAAVRAAQAKESIQVGRSLGIRQAVATETADERAVERVRGLLTKYQAQGIPEGGWKRKLKSGDRAHYREALDLVAA